MPTKDFHLKKDETFISFINQAVDEHSVSICVLLMRKDKKAVAQMKQALNKKILNQDEVKRTSTVVVRKYTYSQPFRYYSSEEYGGR